jgi:hypothetical protein
LDQTRIAKIERDPTLISVGQLLTILRALGVQVALLPPAQSTNKPGARGDSADW